jgi:hypothetical protein
MKTGHLEKGIDGKKQRVYPSISIDERDFPNVKNWSLDKTVELTIKVKVTEVGRRSWDDKKAYARVDIVDMRKAEKEEKYEEEYARKMNRANS